MIRAFVSDGYGFGAFGVGISLILDPDSERPRIYRLAALEDGRISYTWEQIERGMEIEPTLRLGHPEAVALMTALNAHFSGVDDQRMLRADYDAERKRVDKLTDAVAGIAQTLAVQRAEGS